MAKEKVVVPVERAIRVLNQALRDDPKAVNKLFNIRVRCNEKLAKHPTIQVKGSPGRKKYTVGLLGIINGIFGISKHRRGYGFLTMYCNDLHYPNTLIRFERTKRT